MYSTQNHTTVKLEVSITNIPGVTEINVAKRATIWLPNYEYLPYYLNYCVHMQLCVKFEVLSQTFQELLKKKCSQNRTNMAAK